MERFAYSGLLAIFFILTYWELWHVYKKEFKRQWKLIVAMTIFCTVGTLITIPLGAAWGAWSYDFNKTWNIHVGADLLETIFWGGLSGLPLGLMIGIYASKEEKNKKLL